MPEIAMLARSNALLLLQDKKEGDRESDPLPDFFCRPLGRLYLLLSLCENASAVKRIVNNFANRRRVRVNVHAVAGAKVAQNAFCSNIASHPTKLRIATSLDVVNS